MKRKTFFATIWGVIVALFVGKLEADKAECFNCVNYDTKFCGGRVTSIIPNPCEVYSFDTNMKYPNIKPRTIQPWV